jgi:hypothetical protein
MNWNIHSAWKRNFGLFNQGKFYPINQLITLSVIPLGEVTTNLTCNQIWSCRQRIIFESFLDQIVIGQNDSRSIAQEKSKNGPVLFHLKESWYSSLLVHSFSTASIEWQFNLMYIYYLIVYFLLSFTL